MKICHRCVAASFVFALMILPVQAADMPYLTNQELLDFQIVRIGDTDRSCQQLSQEAGRMQAIVSDKQLIQDDAHMKTRGIQAAGTIGSVVLGAATAGIGLGVAGFLASEAIASEAEEADTLQDKAAERRSFIVGIYNAKGCTGPIEHVMVDRDIEQIVTQLAPAAGTHQDRTAALNYTYQQEIEDHEKNLPSFGRAVLRNTRYND